MAIKDLLWACPRCATEGALQKRGRDERCSECGTRYRRVQGALIEARSADGTRAVRSAAGWTARLPPLTIPGVMGQGTGDSMPPRQERVLARFADGDRVLRRRGHYLGRIERFGPERAVLLVLGEDRLRLRDDDDTIRDWPLEALTAVQPSSSALQLKVRGEPVVSFRFPHGSIRLWEELIQAALRRHYRTRNLGEIVEFQPRIVTR